LKQQAATPGSPLRPLVKPWVIRLKIIMPNWLSKERIDINQKYGSRSDLISKEQGGFLGSIQLAEYMAAQSKAIFLPQQFEINIMPKHMKQPRAPKYGSN